MKDAPAVPHPAPHTAIHPDHRRKLPACANCHFVFAAAAPDNFCPRCGQENHELNVPARHLLLELLDGTFDFDTKIFRTLRLLLFRPGQLTTAFNTGHRIDYVSPIRLYVFISFLFFLLLSLQPQHARKGVSNVNVKTPDFTITEKDAKTGKPIAINLDKQTTDQVAKLETREQLDSFLLASNIKPGFINRIALKQAVRLNSGGQAEFWQRFLSDLSLLMFVLMPVFALLLKLLYKRWHRHYIEFLIFSLHYHSFLFVAFSCYLLSLYLGESDVAEWATQLLAVGYLPLALRSVYPQRWPRVLLKSLLLLGFYAVVLGFFMLVTLLISFALF